MSGPTASVKATLTPRPGKAPSGSTGGKSTSFSQLWRPITSSCWACWRIARPTQQRWRGLMSPGSDCGRELIDAVSWRSEEQGVCQPGQSLALMPSRGRSWNYWGKSMLFWRSMGNATMKACVRCCRSNSSVGNGGQQRVLTRCILLCSREAAAYDMLLVTACPWKQPSDISSKCHGNCISAQRCQSSL